MNSTPTPSLDGRGLPPGYDFMPEWELTPRQVKSMMDQKEKFIFIDCRLPDEWRITRIEGARLMPLQQIQQHMDELRGNENEKVVIHCRSGHRSLRMAQFLRQQGFADVKSVAGGILLWNTDIRPGGPQY